MLWLDCKISHTLYRSFITTFEGSLQKMCSPVDLSSSEFFYLQVLEPAQKIKLWQGPEKKHQFINTKKKHIYSYLYLQCKEKTLLKQFMKKTQLLNGTSPNCFIFSLWQLFTTYSELSLIKKKKKCLQT